MSSREKVPNHENKPNTTITADLKRFNRTREMNNPLFFIGYEQFCLEKYEIYFAICFSYEFVARSGVGMEHLLLSKQILRK